MNKSRNRETLLGTGKIYKGKTNIATALYSLRINRDFVVDDSNPGSGGASGLKDYTCQISVLDGERDLFDEGLLVLQLMDGRRWKFVVASGDIFSGNYKAISSGGKGPV